MSFKLNNENFTVGWKEVFLNKMLIKIIFTFKIHSAESLNSRPNGISIYTTHIGEDDVLLQAHETSLDPYAVPMITLQNTKRTYLGMWLSSVRNNKIDNLGHPFTPCVGVERIGMNRHMLYSSEEAVEETVYKEYTCLQLHLADTIFKECNCYPDYIDDIYAMTKSKPEIACSFTQHATCAAHVIRGFEWSNRKLCPLECSGYRFHKHSVQVSVTKI